MKNYRNILVFMALILTGIGTSTSVIKAQAPGDLVIAEIGADPASAAGLAEPADEYFVICNRTATTFNLAGFTVTDNGTTTLTLPQIVLPGNGCVVIANAAINLTATGYNCAAAPRNLYRSPDWFSNGLSNTGDRLGLFNTTPTLIDGVSYGSDITYLNPAATDVFNNSGATLARVTYPGLPSAYPDTNTAADFAARANGTPCDAPFVNPTAGEVFVGGRVMDNRGKPIAGALVTLSGGFLTQSRTVRSSGFGYFGFKNVSVGDTYVISASHKRFSFDQPTQIVNLIDEENNLLFTGTRVFGGASRN